MKIKISVIIIFIIFIIASNSAIGYAETSEVSVNETYKKMYWLFKECTDESYVINYGTDSLNYGVEILTKAPNSLEAYLTIFFINDIFDRCDYKDINNKFYYKIKDKHLQNFDNPDFEPGEKIIFLTLYSGGVDVKLGQEKKENQLKVMNILNTMKENCVNKDYAALANAMLFLTINKEKRMESIKFFLDNFPAHPAIPTVKLIYITYLYDNEPQKCIDEINNLKNQYGKIKMPNGWNFSSDCHEEIVRCYINLKDYNNAIKYYDLIKNEAPNAWNLNNMKKYIDEINEPLLNEN